MAKRRSGLAASSKAIDPTLDALFSASAGPTKTPSKSRYANLIEKKERDAAPLQRAALNASEDAEGDDEELSEISEELDDEDDRDDEEEEADSDAGVTPDAEPEAEIATPQITTATVDETENAEEPTPRKERKRRRKDENDDLESRYLAELAKEEEPAERAGKRQKKDEAETDEDEDQIMSDDDDDDEKPLHESLAQESTTKASEVEKAARTVFVANVASEAASSKTAKKTLLSHLSTILEKDDAPIESIRFRSLAFSTGSMPKRAAFITKAVMTATTKSANAYVVYGSPALARKAATELNGTEVLGRHIRVDSVAHPSPTDHRRCVFVGNLGFVDDESVLTTNDDGETVQKKRNKVPSDVEEGLWRTFSTQGKVENVRVVRDPKTRVGKGFAYVQFYDANDVESALLLNEKKFPPMLPRALRVTRAKDPRKTALAQERAGARAAALNGALKRTKYQPKITPEQQSKIGRAGKLLGRAGAFFQRKGGNGPEVGDKGPLAGMKTPEQVVFEGRRASSRDALPKDLKGKKGKGKGKPKTRSARRATDWKKSKK